MAEMERFDAQFAVPEMRRSLFASLHFDRCTNPCSLHPPPAALAGVAHPEHGMLRRHSPAAKATRADNTWLEAAWNDRRTPLKYVFVVVSFGVLEYGCAIFLRVYK